MQEGDGSGKSELFIRYYSYKLVLFEFIMKPGMSGGWKEGKIR